MADVLDWIRILAMSYCYLSTPWHVVFILFRKRNFSRLAAMSWATAGLLYPVATVGALGLTWLEVSFLALLAFPAYAIAAIVLGILSVEHPEWRPPALTASILVFLLAPFILDAAR